MSRKKPKNTSIKKMMRRQGEGREKKNPIFSAVVLFLSGWKCVSLVSVTVIHHENSARFSSYQSLNSESAGGKTA